MIPTRKEIIIFIHAFVIWALCGATIAVGRSIVGMRLTLFIHAILAPTFAALITYHYFKRFNYTKPLDTALIFLGLVMVLDAGIVAPVFEKSFAMFRSPLGTWIPFAFIFLSTYLTGLKIINKAASA